MKLITKDAFYIPILNCFYPVYKGEVYTFPVSIILYPKYCLILRLEFVLVQQISLIIPIKNAVNYPLCERLNGWAGLESERYM